MTTTDAKRIYFIFASTIRQRSSHRTLLGNSIAFWFGHVADQTFHEFMIPPLAQEMLPFG